MNKKDKWLLIKVVGFISLMAIGVLYAAHEYKMDLLKTASTFVPDGVIKSKAEQKVFMDACNKPLYITTSGEYVTPTNYTQTGYMVKDPIKRVEKIESNYNKAIYYFQKQIECNSEFDDNIELYMQTHDYKYVNRAKKYNRLAKTYCDSLQIIAKQK